MKNILALLTLLIVADKIFAQSNSCEIFRDKDKFSKVVSYSTATLDTDDLTISFNRYKGYLLLVFGIRESGVFCLNKKSTLTFLFTDQTTLKINHTASINCSGNLLSNTYNPNISRLTPLAKKTIEAIRIEGTKDFRDITINEETAKLIRTQYSCILKAKTVWN